MALSYVSYVQLSPIMSSPGSSDLADRRDAGSSAPDYAGEDDAAALGRIASSWVIETAADDRTAKLGYKQELRRNFSMIEVFGIAFSIMGLLPSIASILAYSIPAGPVGMVWVSSLTMPVICRRLLRLMWA